MCFFVVDDVSAEHESHALEIKATNSAWWVVSCPVKRVSLCEMVQHRVASSMFFQAAFIIDGQM